MQSIQDKDFDQLFKDAFADAEVAPSRDLWSSIESEIEPKKTRKLPVYWLAAAVILVVATVGILINREQNITKPDKSLVVNKVETKPVLKENQPKEAIKEPVKTEGKVIKVLPIERKSVTSLVKTKIKHTQKEAKQKVATAPEIVKQETVITKAEEPKKDVLKEKIQEAIQPKEEVIIARNGTTVIPDEVINENEQSNKGIRNVGDLINLVVNKVDKRKDKFIQFRTDDDDSSLSSINIGPFKIGKRNKNRP